MNKTQRDRLLSKAQGVKRCWRYAKMVNTGWPVRGFVKLPLDHPRVVLDRWIEDHKHLSLPAPDRDTINENLEIARQERVHSQG